MTIFNKGIFLGVIAAVLLCGFVLSTPIEKIFDSEEPVPVIFAKVEAILVFIIARLMFRKTYSAKNPLETYGIDKLPHLCHRVRDPQTPDEVMLSSVTASSCLMFCRMVSQSSILVSSLPVRVNLISLRRPLCSCNRGCHKWRNVPGGHCDIGRARAALSAVLQHITTFCSLVCQIVLFCVVFCISFQCLLVLSVLCAIFLD